MIKIGLLDVGLWYNIGMENVRKSAFAVYAAGRRHIAYKNNLVRLLRKYVPEADVVEMDPLKFGPLLDKVPDDVKPTFARLAIPLVDDFRKYRRVVWVDDDVDILSANFSRIMDPDVVKTSDDGLAAATDIRQVERKRSMRKRFPAYDAPVYFNAGVLVMDIPKIDVRSWREGLEAGIAEYAAAPLEHCDQDVLNAYFEIAEMDPRFNFIWQVEPVPNRPAWLVHYCDPVGHARLDRILSVRRSCGLGCQSWRDRCVVVSLRHAFIRSWIRAYFASGNNIPLVIVPGPPGDWQNGDMEYCRKAAEYCGGMVFDCSREWEDSRRLADRAVLKDLVGWYTKKSILHAVATRLAPKSWAWVDDDIEITGHLGECFRYAEGAPGFICTQFYCSDEIDNRHPDRTFRSDIDTGDKISWNSFMFFHGDANERLAESLGRDFPVEDDEIVFCDLYRSDPRWHEGFCDFFTRNWQAICKRVSHIPRYWKGKALHYTSRAKGGEVKKMWAAKANLLPRAFFERGLEGGEPSAPEDGAVDAVFVIGTGSKNGNEELRYALRNLDAHCKFVRNVYICGFCPEWVDKTKVRHLQWPDRFEHAKDANIIDKLRHACEVRGIAKRILFCSDDQFQTRECRWEDFRPRYLRRYQSNDTWYEARNRTWHYRLVDTLERDVGRRQGLGLEACDVFYYQPHMWMQIDRDKFLEYARKCGYEERDDTIIASGYFNFVDADGVPDFDHEFLGRGSGYEPVSTHVAYHDPSYEAAMSILRKMFPAKSRFEL